MTCPRVHRLGQQRKDGAVLALGGNLSCRRPDCDDQRRNPYEQQADVLEITRNFRVVEETDRSINSVMSAVRTNST